MAVEHTVTVLMIGCIHGLVHSRDSVAVSVLMMGCGERAVVHTSSVVLWLCPCWGVVLTP